MFIKLWIVESVCKKIVTLKSDWGDGDLLYWQMKEFEESFVPGEIWAQAVCFRMITLAGVLFVGWRRRECGDREKRRCLENDLNHWLPLEAIETEIRV